MNVKTLIVLFLLLISQRSIANDQSRDGAFWQSLSERDKLVYLVGALDGVTTGAFYSVAMMKNAAASAKNSEAGNAFVDALMATITHHLRGMSSTQLRDGLNTFYKDPKNHPIVLSYAIPLTIRVLRGEFLADDELTLFRSLR